MGENRRTVRVAIVGVGNCAASLVQGVHYYRDADPSTRVPGLMHVQFGDYHVRDVEFVANNPGDWHFHCHLPHHMMNQMASMVGPLMMSHANAPRPGSMTAGMGIIEYAFAGISAVIGQAVVDRGWVSRERLVHYKLHAEIDERHAEEFFAIIEPAWDQPDRRDLIEQGLRLGAYIFDRLYRDMYAAGQEAGEHAPRPSPPPGARRIERENGQRG